MEKRNTSEMQQLPSDTCEINTWKSLVKTVIRWNQINLDLIHNSTVLSGTEQILLWFLLSTMICSSALHVNLFEPYKKMTLYGKFREVERLS